jgi:hypothetical protein
MKNKTSSRGKLKIKTPIRYRSLKFQIPMEVNQISHAIKKVAGMRIAGHRYFHFL